MLMKTGLLLKRGTLAGLIIRTKDKRNGQLTLTSLLEILEGVDYTEPRGSWEQVTAIGDGAPGRLPRGYFL